MAAVPLTPSAMAPSTTPCGEQANWTLVEATPMALVVLVAVMIVSPVTLPLTQDQATDWPSMRPPPVSWIWAESAMGVPQACGPDGPDTVTVAATWPA